MSEGRGISLLRREVIGWSLYDFANTIYSMNIVSLYLKRYIVEDLNRPDYWYDIPFATSMLIAAIVLPGLGAISDHSRKKKTFLFLFTLTACSSVGLMALVPSPAIFVLIILFIVANFSYEAGQPFYNSLLYSVAEGREARLVSGYGVALGYVGSILGMLLVYPFVTGKLFGTEIYLFDAGGKGAAFLPTAIIFMLCALPIFLWVDERPPARKIKTGIRQSYVEVWDALKSTRKYPGVLRFLIADYFVEDAAMTVVVNIGIYCSIVLGLNDEQINMFLIISTVAAVIGSFLTGLIASVWSLKRLLIINVLTWVVALIMFTFTENMLVVWVLGSVVGILLGGLWTITRPMLAELVPHDELGKFFGLFALSGRAAAIVGPLLWTVVVYFLSAENPVGSSLGERLGLNSQQAINLPYKAAVLSLAVVMLFGLYLFRKVPSSTGSTDGN